MVQLLETETDVMVQFLAPEIVIMGERNYIHLEGFSRGATIHCMPHQVTKTVTCAPPSKTLTNTWGQGNRFEDSDAADAGQLCNQELEGTT